MQVIFELEHRADDPETAVRYHLEEAGVDRAQWPFTIDLVRGTLEHQAEIDEEIGGASPPWELGQMAGGGRAGLRAGPHHVLVCPAVPLHAPLNHAVEPVQT